MIGRHGIATLEYEEALGANPPVCLAEVAACLWAGFRLVRSPGVNVENVITGKSRLPQFRQAKRAELQRLVRVHFIPRPITFDGREVRLSEWVQLYRTDPALRRVVHGHVNYAKWRDGLVASFARQPLTALAQEGERQCFGRVGGDAGTLRAMHEYMEEGGI